jgi:hypothetical protein
MPCSAIIEPVVKIPTRFAFARWMLLALVPSLPACAAHAADEATVIRVTIENGQPQRFDAASLAKLPQHEVHAQAHDKSVACQGPTLIDVLSAAGAPHGDQLRSGNLALYVRVSAADGYRAVFALAELDPGFREALPIVTGHCDGAPLDGHDGPFRLIVPDEKRPARWVRQVTAIDVLRSP